jgi:type II secretory pathway pseudopilin PulG
LLELLIVFGVIGLLAAVATPVVNLSVNKARTLKCKAQIAQLAAVMEAYKMEYGSYPLRYYQGESKPDDAWNDHNSWDEATRKPSFQGSGWLHNMLGGDTALNANTFWPNPRGIAFLKANSSYTGSLKGGIWLHPGRPWTYAMTDPWGNAFAWKMDGDGDGLISVGTGDANWRPLDAPIEVRNKGYIIMSKGPDPVDPSDNICSWK